MGSVRASGVEKCRGKWNWDTYGANSVLIVWASGI